MQQQKQVKPKRQVKEKFVDERESKAKPIVAKTEAQRSYIKALQTDTLIVAEGRAGCGKSFVAASIAANKLLKGDIDHIVLTRAYVPMGRSIGMLPGTATEKLVPFLLPSLEVLKQVMGVGAVESGLGKTLHLQPLEAVRGMSFKDCFVICEEAQNMIPEEMRSLVTRIGENTQLVLCGDTYQTDIKGENGLTYIKNIIQKYNIQNTSIIEFGVEDIVRSGICKEFVMAFDQEGKNK